MNARVEIAPNGKLAIEKLSEHNFDIVLMDIQMPVMDGVEATRFIREQMALPKSGIPIIALTAHALKDDEQKYLGLGMNGYLSKPFTSDNLFSTILKTLHGTTSGDSQNKTGAKTIAENKLYDLSAFRSMSSGDPEFMKNVVSTFINSTGKGLREINEHIQSADYAGIKSLAHAIKPGLKMIERTDVSDMLEQIESLAAQEAPMSNILLLTHKIEKAFGQIRAGLEKEIIN